MGFTTLPEMKPDLATVATTTTEDPTEVAAVAEEEENAQDALLKTLHTLLLETQVMEGALVCANCGHEYAIKEGIANFLLPSHLGALDFFPFFSPLLFSFSFFSIGTPCVVSFTGGGSEGEGERRDSWNEKGAMGTEK